MAAQRRARQRDGPAARPARRRRSRASRSRAPSQANAVFAILPPALADAVRPEFPFYTWDESTGEVRWMCSWDTTEADVSGFATALEQAAAAV